MSSQTRTGSRRGRMLKASAVAVLAATALTACSEQSKIGFLPTERGVTDSADHIIDLWIGSWVAALAIGLVTWGLMLWCMIAYRRRPNETGYPRQLAYHAPLEIFYTVVPVAMVISLFFFSSRAQNAITARHDNPDTTIQVYGKQWAWDFNYLDENVYYQGTQAHLTGKEGVEETLPTLYLPADSKVEVQLTSRDVIHSFWVPAFLEKVDMFPDRTNYMSFTTGQEGVFAGKCAELCGEYHSEMLFNVAIVNQDEYDAQMSALRDEGNVGQVGEEYSRNQNSSDKNEELTANADQFESTDK